MGVKCEILIQKPREGVHTAGKPVQGTVRYTITEPTEYKDIKLSLVGKAECSWTETHNSGRRNQHRTITYTGTEYIVDNYISILIRQPGFTAVLPIGTYAYNFKFMLPENIPPSFKDSVGSITYQIRLKFEKPNFFSFNDKFATTLNVTGDVKPETSEGKRTFGLDKSLIKPFSKRHHIINLKADISNTFFTPGQNSNITYTVTNNTDVKVTAVKTELLCCTTYTANCGRNSVRVKTITDSQVETPSVPADAVANMTSVLPVQAHLYSIQNCKVIKKEYYVKATLRLPFPYINASVEFPIVVGEKRDERINEGALFAREVPGPSVEAVEDSRTDPPSYWEAMNENFDEKGDKGND